MARYVLVDVDNKADVESFYYIINGQCMQIR